MDYESVNKKCVSNFGKPINILGWLQTEERVKGEDGCCSNYCCGYSAIPSSVLVWDYKPNFQIVIFNERK